MCVFAGCIVLYKPRASRCSGEMFVPASVPTCSKGELGLRRNLSGAAHKGQAQNVSLFSLRIPPSQPASFTCLFVSLDFHLTLHFLPLLSSRFSFSCVGTQSMWRVWWKLRNFSVLSSASLHYGTRRASPGDIRPPASSKQCLL